MEKSKHTTLSEWHTRFAGGVLWNVTDQGVGIAGASPVGTPGPPETARRVLGWFSEEIADAARAYQVPEALLVAIICTESAGGQTDLGRVISARREEPGFVSDVATPMRVSTGCCQTLLSTARAALGQPHLTSEDLAHPATSIRAAAAYIASQAHVTALDPPLVAAAYNAGSVYEDKAPANRWRMRCYPVGSGAYIDRFIRWYNDAKSDPTFRGETSASSTGVSVETSGPNAQARSIPLDEAAAVSLGRPGFPTLNRNAGLT